MDTTKDISSIIEEATLDFTLGENETALKKLEQALEINPQSFEALHAKTEVLFSDRKLEDALQAAEAALKICPEDIHINISLSRIWVELGDKQKAEHYNAQARMLGWKDQIQNPSQNGTETEIN